MKRKITMLACLLVGVILCSGASFLRGAHASAETLTDEETLQIFGAIPGDVDHCGAVEEASDLKCATRAKRLCGRFGTEPACIAGSYWELDCPTTGSGSTVKLDECTGNGSQYSTKCRCSTTASECGDVDELECSWNAVANPPYCTTDCNCRVGNACGGWRCTT